ncbi:MAG: XrtA/PEP-CTERM system amidotransferase [Burkholderiales bacterium]|jgi:asparagine synthase (glutamine-hydrolysing)
MCGLTALFDPGRPSLADPDQFRQINDLQTHRGPDEGAVHIEPHIALGHRRLSVIDLATGQQPLANEDGSIVVVFNGEIYNFQDLRQELTRSGHRFATSSDTEVLVHGWEQWGVGLVARLRGMFAFVLWDRPNKTLFAARDRLGVKPLHYGQLTDGRWAFGSELKTIIDQPGFNRRTDARAVEDYLALGYIPDPESFWIGARKLPPGHHLVFRVGQTAPIIERYWQVDFSSERDCSLEQACDELRQLLSESIGMRLVSEVPLGAFLSGGVDSSTVVAFMAGLQPSPVQTCAIGFDQSDHDETVHAREVARLFATEHHEHQVSADDFGLIDTLARLYDEPFADSSAIPTYRLCQMARKHVTVALSGDGGDETFAGYRRYRLHLREERIRQLLPAALRQPLFGTLGRFYPKFDRLPRVLRARTTFQALARSTGEAYFNSVAVMREEVRKSLRSDHLSRELSGYRSETRFESLAGNCGSADPLKQIQAIDYATWLPGDINTKVDRASMAHSLEVREPLMDHRLVEWAARLPSSLKLKGSVGKRVLKTALSDTLPHSILHRSKMGFSVPLAHWLRGPLSSKAMALASSPALADSALLNLQTLKRMAEDHVSGRADFSRPLWSILMLEAVLRRS